MSRIFFGELVVLGYVRKERDARDSRVTKIRLTSEGRALEANFTLISKELLKQVYSGFTKEEKQNIIHLLGIMNNNL